jgi:outer membrane protein
VNREIKLRRSSLRLVDFFKLLAIGFFIMRSMFYGLYVTSFVFVLSVFPNSSFGDGLKIGFVSTDRVFKESAPAIKSQKNLQKEFSGREEVIRQTSEKARSLQNKLEKEGLTMSDSERQAAESDLGRLSRDLQRLQREFKEELNLRKNQEMKLVLELANQAIFKIAEKEKYDLILQEAVYRSPRLDITDKVIEALENE